MLSRPDSLARAADLGRRVGALVKRANPYAAASGGAVPTGSVDGTPAGLAAPAPNQPAQVNQLQLQRQQNARPPVVTPTVVNLPGQMPTQNG